MIRRRIIQIMLGGSAGLLAAWPKAVEACSVCFGNPEAPMNQGMAWGIMSLLFVIGSVLGGIVAVTVYLAKRNAAMASAGCMELEQESRGSESAVDAEDPWAAPFVQGTGAHWMHEPVPDRESELEPAGK